MKSVLALLILSNACYASLLSELTLRADVSSIPATTQIGFSVAPMNGVGAAYNLNSLSGVQYQLPDSTVSLMYSMANNPAPYQSHGPVLATLNIGDWVQDSWHKFWADSVSVLSNSNYYGSGVLYSNACCTLINGTPEALTVPWKSVLLSRTAWQQLGSAYSSTLTVSVYDQLVPEPAVSSMCLFALSLVLSTRGTRSGS
jgi:hypothetical protein